MANKPYEFPKFTPIDDLTMRNMLDKMTKYLYNVCGALKIDHGELEACREIIYEIIERVEKRRVYFHIYYEDCVMGELNEGALICFWILKFHPFKYSKFGNNALNAKIALFLFINMLCFYANSKNIKLKPSGKICEDIYYAFRFRDLSKEAIMLLAESLLN
ncbi:MAG: hypothetical protein FWH53_09235 [Leptospirales bacterium]|nr:hypothetical protein [Leptospirales bacterium]